MDINLDMNDPGHALAVDRTNLREALRQQLGLTRTTQGRDQGQGQCRPCTVRMDGRRHAAPKAISFVVRKASAPHAWQ